MPIELLKKNFKLSEALLRKQDGRYLLLLPVAVRASPTGLSNVFFYKDIGEVSSRTKVRYKLFLQSLCSIKSAIIR